MKTAKKRLQLNMVENVKNFHCIEFLKKVEEIKMFEILYQVQVKAYNSMAYFIDFWLCIFTTKIC